MNEYYFAAKGGAATLSLDTLSGYSPNDANLIQIGQFNLFVGSKDTASNVVLPSAANVKLGTTRILVVDDGNSAGTNSITISAADGLKINGSSTYTIAANSGSAFLVLLTDNLGVQSWVTPGYAGASGAVTANNGLSLSGSTVQLGAALIQSTTITGLQTYPLVFQSTDGTSYVATFGTAQITFSNADSVSSINRQISLLSKSAASPGFTANGGIIISEAWSNSNVYFMQIKNAQTSWGIANTGYSAGYQSFSFALIDPNFILVQKNVNNATTTSAASLINGFVISDVSADPLNGIALFYNSAANLLLGGTSVLSLTASGLTFQSGSTPVFLVNTAGIIVANGLTNSVPVTPGTLYRSSASPNATVLIV